MAEFIVSPLDISGVGTSTEVAPMQPVGVSRVRKLLLAATAVLAAGGCTLDQDKKPDENLHVSPVAVNIAQGLATDRFGDALNKSPADTSTARSMVPGLANGSPEITNSMNLAINAATAYDYLTKQRSLNENDPIAALPTTTDMSLQVGTAKTIYVIEAGRLVKKAEKREDGFSLHTAHQALSEDVPAGAESVKVNAAQALDAAYAKDLVDDFSIAEGKEDQARAALADIKDPIIRSLAADAVDGIDAGQLLKDVWIDRQTFDQARQDAANIANTNIRNKTLQAIANAAQDKYSAGDVGGELISSAYDIKSGFYKLGAPFREDQNAADSFYYGTAAMRSDAIKAANVGVGQRIAAAHHVTPKTLEAVNSIPNPREVVDLSKVEGLQPIANNCLEVASDDDQKKKCGDKILKQFGELFVKDGVLTLNFQDGGGLTETIRSQIQTAVEYSRPFLEAAFASGELTSVHFTIGESFDPMYVGATRETYMILPKDKSVSMDQFVSSLDHETKHALTRNFFAEINVSDEQITKLNSACNNLRIAAYNDFRTKLLIKPELLTDIRDVAKFEHEPIIDTLIRSVKDATFGKVVGLDAGELEFQLPSTHVNECREVMSSSADIIKNAVKESGVEASADDLKYLFKTDAFNELALQWANFIDYASVYDKVINESAYVQTGSPDRTRFGHSEDRASELYASLPNAALNYPVKFKAGLQKLSDDERHAVLDLLDLCLEEYAKHPSLAEYVALDRAEYAAMR